MQKKSLQEGGFTGAHSWRTQSIKPMRIADAIDSMIMRLLAHTRAGQKAETGPEVWLGYKP